LKGEKLEHDQLKTGGGGKFWSSKKGGGGGGRGRVGDWMGKSTRTFGKSFREKGRLKRGASCPSHSSQARLEAVNQQTELEPQPTEAEERGDGLAKKKAWEEALVATLPNWTRGLEKKGAHFRFVLEEGRGKNSGKKVKFPLG